MRNSVICPLFEEQSYKGQDIVNYGIKIPLGTMSNDAIFKRFSRNAGRIIEKQPAGLIFQPLEDKHLPMLRELWFDPQDKTFPDTLGTDHFGLVAIMAGKDAEDHDMLLGGIIWADVGNRTAFLHQLVSGEHGKKLGIPTHLIWQSVLSYNREDRSIDMLDIGVSYNPARYKFFENFKVETYPIILKKPFYVPIIRLTPFRRIEELRETREDFDWKEHKATFFPRGSYALYGGLKHIGVTHGDKVGIVKTFPTHFISGCVTGAIEKTGASWQNWPNERDLKDLKALVVVHEFGVAANSMTVLSMVHQCKELGIPVIEDCAWSDKKILQNADYSVFSLQKILPVNYGGILMGVHLDDDFMWKIGCLDAFKRERAYFEEEEDAGEPRRRDLWHLYHRLVTENGMTPDGLCDWEDRASAEWMPTVYMQSFASDEEANAIVARLEEFGIQAGRYWGTNSVYLPIHQSMTDEEVRYMFAVVRGYFNLCRDYGKNK